MPGPPTGDADLVLVGGGLQNGLIALAALHADPARRVVLVEAGVTIGGNHTWCVDARDIPLPARPWAERLIVHRWPAYEVRFPGFARRVGAPYVAITSDRFAAEVEAAVARSPAAAIRRGRRAIAVGPHQVTLDDGSCLAATVVVDARGPERAGPPAGSGFQKFLGLEIRFERPHGIGVPVLMDATVPQRDGFRFLYTLPFGPDRLLVEDTYFSRSPHLDPDAARTGVQAYAERFGRVAAVVREESGVLPMPWSGAPVAPHGSPLVAGYRGGWFHPATGYSLPPALRLACHAGTRPSDRIFDASLARMARAHRGQVWFAQMLNRLLFNCFAPEDAWNVFARFYTLPDDVIERFYGLRMTPLDRARLLVGRPPRGFSLAQAFVSRRAA